MLKNCLLKLYLLPVIVFFFPAKAIGGGFENMSLGMKATAMGGAFTAVSSDASAAFYNPGAMSFLEFSQISLGSSFTLGSTSYLSPYTGNTDMQNKFSAHLHAYGVGMINEKMAVGISINNPFCLRTSWDENWTGRYIARETKISATYVQPAISYMFGESFSAGIGPVIAFGKTFHSSAIPYNSNTGEIGEELDGNSTGFGVNVGLFYKPGDKFSAGLTYRSPVKMNVKSGDVSFSNVPASLASEFPASTSFSTEYTLPSVISLGAMVRITRELILTGDINYSTWSSFDTLVFTFENQPDLNFGRGEFYKNTYALRIGAEYRITDQIAVRAGGAFEKSAVTDSYLSPENPDADKYVFSAGGSFKLGQHVVVDVAYMLENYEEREVTNKELNFKGNYKSLNNIFGLTVNYVF